MPKVTPRRMVLNMLRIKHTPSAPVKRIVEIGGIFGFTSNSVRVAITRLAAEGLVESDERGFYRLSDRAAPVSRHAEAWRQGEQRRRPWDGSWLTVAMPAGVPRTTRRHSLRALGRLGFREGLAGLWVRPDNLAETRVDSFERLVSFGLDDESELFVSRGFSKELVARWHGLWPRARLERSYRRAIKQLEQSSERLPQMPKEQAMLQSYLLGGEAIHILATDPLLPDEIMSSGSRAELTSIMLRYDKLGRSIWRGVWVSPSLRLVRGGRGN